MPSTVDINGTSWPHCSKTGCAHGAVSCRRITYDYCGITYNYCGLDNICRCLCHPTNQDDFIQGRLFKTHILCEISREGCLVDFALQYAKLPAVSKLYRRNCLHQSTNKDN